MSKKWLFLLILALILALWIWPKSEVEEAFPKKVRFDLSKNQVKKISGRKVDNFSASWRENMTRNRRIVQLEKMARQRGILGPNDYIDFVRTSRGRPSAKDNQIMALARTQGLVHSGEWLQVI